ncbi:MAG: acyl-ACP desaturase [Acidobacteriota bacterium]
MNRDIERYLTVSAKIDTSDLDWAEAARAGLTPDEIFALTYFSDIESQTIRYLQMLLGMKIAFEPAIAAFLSTWSYEEFFHGHALARLLDECGHRLEENRVEVVKRRAGLNEWLEKALGPVFSRLFSSQFPSLYMAFGAVQELTTLRGYERLGERTSNPVLRTLCQRIAKQERRHFAWYFNHAREQLANSRSAQFITRRLLDLVWVPVGAGVKSRDEVVRLFSILFPGRHGMELVSEVDAKIGTLPGLTGIRLMQSYFERAVDRCSNEGEGVYELG